ncbi:MAG: proline--tRNA ligase [Dehalococcoidia bacterium]|nr:proline--tRNA ligase [Dehalococcoidia bacterium]
MGGKIKLSKYYWSTSRNISDDSEMLSHRLLIRSGYISQLGAGIFSFTPIGWRVIEKIKNIIRSEMNSIDCHEANFPVVQPSDIWEESGRIDSFIPPLARFTDRRDKIMIIAPTHEESVISMVRSEVNSYRDMPFSLFHIQTKFRDETRPRGGLLRVREFEMKDAYSFHSDQESLDEVYEKFSQAYFNIFNRCGIDVIKVAADSGAIGGKVSSEFISVAENGEDTILKCDECLYAANEEKAEFKKIIKNDTDNLVEKSETETPNIKSIQDLSNFFNLDPHCFIKTMVYFSDKKPILVSLAGDLEVNETKLRNLIGGDVRLADNEEIIQLGLVPGFISPINNDFDLIVDDSINLKSDYIIGANKDNLHISGILPGKEFNIKSYEDIASAKKGFLSVDCDESKCKGLNEYKGIEVGHIFKLGNTYSAKMGLNFIDTGGKQKSVEMGCYGIGVGRLLAAVVEANSSEKELVLNKHISPFQIYIVNLNSDNSEVKEVSNSVYSDLINSDYDVLFDDRDEGPGVKFSDYELSGVPIRIVISKRSIENSEVEILQRGEEDFNMVKIKDIIKELSKLL